MYEEIILARQDSEGDDCKGCEHLQECREGKRNMCVWDMVEEHYNISINV